MLPLPSAEIAPAVVNMSIEPMRPFIVFGSQTGSIKGFEHCRVIDGQRFFQSERMRQKQIFLEGTREKKWLLFSMGNVLRKVQF